jgi:hypothetical protein
VGAFVILLSGHVLAPTSNGGYGKYFEEFICFMILSKHIVRKNFLPYPSGDAGIGEGSGDDVRFVSRVKKLEDFFVLCAH